MSATLHRRPAHAPAAARRRPGVSRRDDAHAPDSAHPERPSPTLDKLPALFVAACISLCIATGTAHSGVFLSELCDPQDNYTTDRFIEIYNSGPDAVDLTDWAVVAVANNVDVTTWPLSGVLAAGQAKVCGGPSTVTGFTVHFQSAVWATTAGYMNWNGKVGDGAKLKNGSGAVIDIVVATGTLFENADLVRNANISNPNAVYTPSEWTATPVALATSASPGTHNGSVASGAGPRIRDLITDPAIPVAGVGTHVQASVVDTSGAIASVTTLWGASAGSMPNSIAMELLSDSTYRTLTQIPAQSAGASIFYRVEAVGASASSQSANLSYTIAGGGGGGAPTVLSVGEMSDSTLLVFFSEPVEEASAETPGNYSVGSLTAVNAVRDPAAPSQVLITVRAIPAGLRTLTVNGVADLEANVAFGATRNFTYIDVSIPPGYYDGMAGLKGSALRVALHNRIRNHNSQSYAFALTAFGTTDVKPNGKIWDAYSDIPGGSPPYEYNVGQTGQGAGEGLGYNREHSFPQSWFNGSSPMYSDLNMLYPTDSYVNGARGNYPFGEVGTPDYTSMNGSRRGGSATPGYSGTVFEPIDPFKGDFSRTMFYVATRYLGQDSSWPGSPSHDGSQPVAWAEAQYRAWSAGDPVSWKERLRNGAVYTFQNNRNPFIDHPEYIVAIYDSNSVAGVTPALPGRAVQLRQNSPNPFRSQTTIGFDLAARAAVSLRIYDVSGRQVRVLADGGVQEAGSHAVEWNGRDDAGALLRAGLYLCKLDANGTSDTRRVVLTR